MAIDYDAKSLGRTSSTSASTLTVSHTCSGSNRCLIVAVYSKDSLTDITGVTHDGTAMTKIDVVGQSTVATPTIFISLWYLANPSTGAKNIVASRTTTGTHFSLNAVSYTGVAQTGNPEANNKNASDSTTSLSLTVTTLTAGAWLVAGAGGQRAVSAGTGTTMRSDGTASLDIGLSMFDSDGGLSPTGSKSLVVTMSENNAVAGIVVVLKPLATGNIKKIGGIAWANVKKISGIAVANIKKTNGITAQ
jgi:hypothetical protein